MLRTKKEMSIQDIQKELGLSKETYYRYIDWALEDEKLKTEKEMK